MPRRPTTWLLLLVPLLLAVAAYARVLGAGFVFDDVPVVVERASLSDLPGTVRAWPGALLQGGRPTTDVTFAIDRAIGGLSPRGYHLGNLLLHLATVLLVFLFTREILRRAGRASVDGVAVAVAGLFALHPLQSEAVSYVAQRSEVLASGLYLATLLLLLRAERAGAGLRGALLGLAALALFVVGMGAKAILATAPLAWLLLLLAVPPEGERPGKGRWGWRLALVAPFVLTTLLLVRGALVSVEGKADAGFSVPRSAPGSYFLTQWRAVTTYLRLLVFPSGQNADWSFPLSASVGEPAVLASGAFLAALLAAAAFTWWRCRRGEDTPAASGRAAAYGVVWFFLVLAPTSSFLPIADVLVEHRVYLAAWGPFLALVLGGEALLGRLPSGSRGRVAVVGVGAVWLALAVALHLRNAVWESDLAFWRDAVAKSPGKARPHLGLGLALAQRGDAAGAVAELSAGLSRAPEDAIGLRVALLHSLGGALIQLGRSPEAVLRLRQAVELDPGAFEPRQGLALALWNEKDLDGAEQAARAALDRAPRAAAATRVMGQVRMARGDDAGAVPFLEQAVRARPNDAPVRYDLGAAYANLERKGDACASWKAVLRLPPAGGAQEAARQGLAILGCPP